MTERILKHLAPIEEYSTRLALLGFGTLRHFKDDAEERRRMLQAFREMSEHNKVLLSLWYPALAVEAGRCNGECNG